MARAGMSTPYHTGSGISRSQANHDGLGVKVVGSYPANTFGLYDVHGNVWEWVEDCWNESYQGAPSDGSAWRNGDCQQPVMRGGSFLEGLQDARSANRDSRSDGLTHRLGYPVGFRVARRLN